MARVQYGVIVTELKGKLGGQVFQKGNVANIIRQKNSRIGTASTARQLGNWLQSAIVAHWRSLSDAQRNSWNTNAADWPFIDKFGNSYTGSGYQFHNAYEFGRALIQYPTFFPFDDTPNAPQSSEHVAIPTITFSNAGTYLVDFGSTTTTTQSVFVYASAPYTAGRNSNNARYRAIAGWGMSVFSSFDIKAFYQAVYGVPPVGSVITVRTEIRTVQWPKVSQPNIQQVIVGA